MSQPVHSEGENPYAPPREEPTGPEETLIFPYEDDSPASLRSTYGQHEATVRTIGLYLYLLAATGVCNIILVLALPRITEQIANRSGPNAVIPAAILKIIVALSGLAGAGLYLLLGLFLSKLHDWARWVLVVFSAYGILGVFVALVIVGSQFKRESIALAIGLMFPVYIMIVLLSSKNKVVLSERYRLAVAATPELSPRQSARDWIFLGMAAAFQVGTIIIQISRALS